MMGVSWEALKSGTMLKITLLKHEHNPRPQGALAGFVKMAFMRRQKPRTVAHCGPSAQVSRMM